MTLDACCRARPLRSSRSSAIVASVVSGSSAWADIAAVMSADAVKRVGGPTAGDNLAVQQHDHLVGNGAGQLGVVRGQQDGGTALLLPPDEARQPLPRARIQPLFRFAH